jgi:hypothetical protein
MHLALWLHTKVAIIFSATSAACAVVECVEAVGPDAALDAGVAAIYAAYSEASYTDVNGKTFETITYRGLADFVARNPDCCTFSTTGQDGFVPTPEWQEKFSFYGFVSATFKAYRVDDNDVKSEVNLTTEVAITTCGKAIWYDVDDDNW